MCNRYPTGRMLCVRLRRGTCTLKAEVTPGVLCVTVPVLTVVFTSFV